MKKTNLLKALVNLAEKSNLEFETIVKDGTRINNVGDSLEYFIKDIFADTLDLKEVKQKEEEYRQYFSWLGNQNNPPDFIIRASDAVEVKKLGGYSGGIALNSSAPKNYLHSDDTRIVRACRDCEDWTKKDMLYAVGVVNDRSIQNLWFVYGDLYAADREVYSRVSDAISGGVTSLPDIEFTETNELGKVKKVDPLGITSLRVRGMWHIKSPFKIYNSFCDNDLFDKSNVFVVLRNEKFSSMSNELSEEQISMLNKHYNILNIDLPDPNNPAKTIKSNFILGSI